MLGDLNTAVCIKQPLPNLSSCPIAICFFATFQLPAWTSWTLPTCFGWMVGFDRSTQWMVGWLTPWTVPTMTVPPPLALKQQVKRKQRMNRTIRRKAGLSCGIIPEALFIITARRAPSHCGLFRLPLAGSTQIKLAFCRTKTGQRWRRLFVFHSHPGIYLPGKHFFATNTRNTIFLRTLSNNTI